MKIRHEVFETNSSSTHSIHFAEGDFVAEKLCVDPDGVCRIYTGEFGWEFETYTDVGSKASYIATFIKCVEQSSENENLENVANPQAHSRYLSLFTEVILEETGATSLEIMPSGDRYFEYGYIDHQSWDGYRCIPQQAFASKETLRNFIFNKNTVLETDNDNH